MFSSWPVYVPVAERRKKALTYIKKMQRFRAQDPTDRNRREEHRAEFLGEALVRAYRVLFGFLEPAAAWPVLCSERFDLQHGDQIPDASMPP